MEKKRETPLWKGLHVIRQEQEALKAVKDMREKYRATFLETRMVCPRCHNYVAVNHGGLEVLADLLLSLNTFAILDTSDPGDVALHNAGQLLLQKLGMMNREKLLEILSEWGQIEPPQLEG